MVIGLIGESCAGKSTLAETIKNEIGAEIITGKDYLRMAKNEREAIALFREKLNQAVCAGHIIYVISEPEHVGFLPERAVRILVSADLDTIKQRFQVRMHGNLPAPVAAMLERKHGLFDDGVYDFRFDGVHGDASALCKAILASSAAHEEK